MKRIVVIGAGAAGLMAAAAAAARGCDVILLEKSNKLGVKILMSGGTRCNITHDTDARGITERFGNAARFLQPSVGAFPPTAVVEMFAGLGVPTKVELTGKVFPQSDRALHVRDALERQARTAGAAIRAGCAVTGLQATSSGWRVMTVDGAVEADRVIVTAGGMSYPGCGTTGDAYPWLRGLGHSLVPTRPALVPLVGGWEWTRSLSGLTVEDCVATVSPQRPGKRPALARRRAPILFTHFGFSGPAAMDVSGSITAADSFESVRLDLDLLPAVSSEALRAMFSDRSRDGGRQRPRNLIAQWLPRRLAEEIATQAGADCTLAELPKIAVRKLIESLKTLPLPIVETRGFPKAEVTAGGVERKEVNPRTMESRIAPGLFIAGEVLDVDGPIGGYNFQAAFSTGRAAGIAASSSGSD